MILAAADAIAPAEDAASASRITATADIRGAEVVHEVENFGEIKLAEKPKLLIRIESRTDGLQSIGVSPEGWPEYVIHPGQTVMLQVRLERDGF